MAEEQGEKRQYQIMRVIATHPTSGEQINVLQTSFQNDISAVAGVLGKLGIPFSMGPVERKQPNA